MNHVWTIEKLSKRLKPISQPQDADAAVAVLLKSVDHDTKIFFVKRVESPTDPWSGQMAFPGGKRDPRDQNLKQTVIRETLEETNINLLDRCRFLGVMTPFRSTRRPEMRVLPFVVLLKHEPTIRLNEELERFIWISPEELVQHEGIARLSFGEVAAYVLKNSVIWGLTYRILQEFFQMIAIEETPKGTHGLQ